MPAKNKAAVEMSKEKLHEFSTTPEKKLPEKKERKLSTREYIQRRNKQIYG